MAETGERAIGFAFCSLLSQESSSVLNHCLVGVTELEYEFRLFTLCRRQTIEMRLEILFLVVDKTFSALKDDLMLLF